MKKKHLSYSLLLGTLMLSSCQAELPTTSDEVSVRNTDISANAEPTLAALDQARVNYILADLSKGVDLEYYQNQTEPEAREALKQWLDGIRVLNADSFERISIPNRGFQIVYKGTQTPIDGKAVELGKPTENTDEAKVRVILVDMSKDADILAYYKTLDTAEAKEAVKRWEQEQIRPVNGDNFERVAAEEGGFQIVYKGTTRPINGMDVTLAKASTDLNEGRVRVILADMSKDPDIEAYYRTQTDAEAQEAVKRWDQGLRPLNAEYFERRPADTGGFELVYKGTQTPINGLDVVLGNQTPQNTPTPEPQAPVEDSAFEAQVRIILVDLSKGVSVDYYKTQTDTPSFEAVKRWEEGIRPVNADIFERKSISGRGIVIVYKGTDIAIDGMAVQLTPPGSLDENRVKYIMAEIALGVGLDYFSNLDEAEADEAVKRWQSGTRIRNPQSFERIEIAGLGPKVVYKGTQTPILGSSVQLKSATSLNEQRVRYIMAELSQGVPLTYYNTVDEPEAKEAQARWQRGLRVKNADSFERKDVVDKGIIITYRGTNTEITGDSVILSDE